MYGRLPVSCPVPFEAPSGLGRISCIRWCTSFRLTRRLANLAGLTGRGLFWCSWARVTPERPKAAGCRIETRDLRNACNGNTAPHGPKVSKIALPVKISLPAWYHCGIQDSISDLRRGLGQAGTLWDEGAPSFGRGGVESEPELRLQNL